MSPHFPHRKGCTITLRIDENFKATFPPSVFLKVSGCLEVKVMMISCGKSGGVPGLSVGFSRLMSRLDTRLHGKRSETAKIFSSIAQKKSRLTTRLKTRFVAPCPNGVPEALAKAGRRPQFSPVVSRSGAAMRCIFFGGDIFCRKRISTCRR